MLLCDTSQLTKNEILSKAVLLDHLNAFFTREKCSKVIVESLLLIHFHFHFSSALYYIYLTVGVCFSFRSGPNAWRHPEKPFSILTRYCETAMKSFNFFPGKNQNPDRIIIGDREYTLSQFGKKALFSFDITLTLGLENI